MYYNQLYVVLTEGSVEQQEIIKTVMEGVYKGIMGHRRILDVLVEQGKVLEKLTAEVEKIKESEDVMSVGTPRQKNRSPK